MKLWTEPLLPRIKAGVRHHRQFLRELAEVFGWSYAAYVVGFWLFGAEGTK